MVFGPTWGICGNSCRPKPLREEPSLFQNPPTKHPPRPRVSLKVSNSVGGILFEGIQWHLDLTDQGFVTSFLGCPVSGKLGLMVNGSMGYFTYGLNRVFLGVTSPTDPFTFDRKLPSRDIQASHQKNPCWHAVNQFSAEWEWNICRSMNGKC